MDDVCEKFHQNPNINPLTGLPVNLQDKSYNYLTKKCGFPQITPTISTNYLRNSINLQSIPKSLPISMMDGLWGVSQTQQRAFEDRYQALKIGPFRFYAIFDGHAGSHNMGPNHVADYAVEHLHERLAKNLSEINLHNEAQVKDTIIVTFINFDREMYNLGKLYGSTCTAILIDEPRNKIYQINLGDSKSIILGVNGIISATKNHEPNDLTEWGRIEASSGYVENNRVMGSLAISRALGDYIYKIDNDVMNPHYDDINGMVISIPDVTVVPIQKPMYIILASDAPYERDAFNDISLSQLFIDKLQLHTITRPNVVASEMVRYIVPRTTDDTSIMVTILI